MNFAIPAAQVLARVKRMPPLPQAVDDLNIALRSDTVQTDRIVRAVSIDPALTLVALRLANSSFYGVSGRVVTLRDAVQILGVQTLSNAVLTAAVLAAFDRPACAGFDFDANWRHALATALCAKLLAQPRGIDECAAYTAGLLHDIGKLALAAHFPDEYAAALARAAEHDLAPIEAERSVLGIDHAVVGGMVAAHWRLAPVLVDTIRLHHEPQGSDAGRLGDLLHIGDAVVHALDLSREAGDMVPPLSIDVWDRAQISAAELQTLFERLEAAMQEVTAGLGH